MNTDPAENIPQRVADIRRELDRLTAPARRDEIGPAADRIAELAAGIAGGEYRPEYNGWKNRETWNASLWINNDEGSYHAARAIAQEAINADPAAGASLLPADYWTPETVSRARIRAAGDALREWWDEENAPDDDGHGRNGPLSDAWTYAVAVVDWYAVAEGVAEDLTPETDDDETDDEG